MNENIGVLSAGERFIFKGFEWITLDNNVDGGVLAIMASAWILSFGSKSGEKNDTGSRS